MSGAFPGGMSDRSNGASFLERGFPALQVCARDGSKRERGGGAKDHKVHCSESQL